MKKYVDSLLSRCPRWVLLLGTTGCIFCLLWGCATAPSEPPGRSYEPVSTRPSLYRPGAEMDLKKSKKPFLGTLPLGIGASFDLFVSETTESMGYFYKSYVKQYRSGQLFKEQPYQLEYSIFPRKGETFNHSNSWSDLSFKSDYDFKIGISRRFQHFSDFFSPQFLLGSGRFSPVAVPMDLESGSDVIPALQENPILLPDEYMTKSVEEMDVPPLHPLDLLLEDRG